MDSSLAFSEEDKAVLLAQTFRQAYSKEIIGTTSFETDSLTLDPIFSPRNITRIGTWNVRALIRHTVIQVYARTDDTDDDVKNDFYGRLQDIIDEVPRRDLKIVLGDFNAQLGGDRHGIERTVGPFASSGHIGDNGERLVFFCDCNNLCVGNTYFQYRRIHKKT
ncbi:hypothetical protein ANCCEY_06793 [Ancylostoma ceylanicum]|uniref:Endonuclease/exonuclease/phosphatase domain-containing protein n=1 Tax=Ancylostoma ceylanicum TaxID=53326 RepID=A0A0D6M2J7_9BILA|nr:hypothetical protein ANCCEY_06793 [Ancylostoma ceylanicum]